MKRTTELALIVAGLALGFSATAAAQAAPATKEMPIFVNVNAGAQTQSRTLVTSTSFPLYGETAVINGAASVDGGGLFDISAGYQIVPRISVGVGFSVFSKEGDGSIAASIPNPNVFNRPATSTVTATGLKHKENATHLLFVYTLPLMNKVEASFMAGPSFFRLTQDVLSASVPAGTQTANVVTQSEKGSKTGGNFGINLNYMYKPNYGGGVFVRYAGAKIDLASASGIKVGGVQIGIGARLKF